MSRDRRRGKKRSKRSPSNIYKPELTPARYANNATDAITGSITGKFGDFRRVGRNETFGPSAKGGPITITDGNGKVLRVIQPQKRNQFGVSSRHTWRGGGLS